LQNDGLLLIFTVLDALSSPATLMTVHVYLALSSSLEPAINSEPSLLVVYRPPVGMLWSSFFHVTDGVGTPLVGHSMVTLVLVSAVTLSPMAKVMGFRSLASIVVGLPGIFMTGLEGSGDERVVFNEMIIIEI